MRFFGFLHSGEFTCPQAAATSDYVLPLSDVGLNSQSNPLFVSVHSHHSKTDIFGVGTLVYFGWVEEPVCRVKAILVYLALRGPIPSPLLIFQDGSQLSHLDLVWAVRSALESQGMDICSFNGRSFCIEPVTTAATHGIEDSLIQALGR